MFQQSPQAKVVIQRNPDMGQLNAIQYQPGQTTQMTYEQHNQMIQNQMQQQQQQAQQLVTIP